MSIDTVQKPKQSFFITVEGIDGAGKSVALEVLHRYFKEHNIDFVATREPGGTQAAEAIRHVIFDHYDHEDIVPTAELLLIFAGRAQHVEHVIRPALEAGKCVISDRFTDASFAYQGGGLGIPEERIAYLEQWVHQGVNPDLTFLLDAPIEVCKQRSQNRGEQNRLDQESIEYFNRVREVYFKRAKVYADRYRFIDTSVTIPEVQQAVLKTIEEFLRR